MGAYFAIGGALSLFVVALPNSTSVWVRVSDEMWGAVFELEITPICLPARSSCRRGCS